MREALLSGIDKPSFAPWKEKAGKELANEWVQVVVICAFTLSAYAYGIWAIFPSLVRDHQRLEIGWGTRVMVPSLDVT
jgi:hypothetical protein